MISSSTVYSRFDWMLCYSLKAIDENYIIGIAEDSGECFFPIHHQTARITVVITITKINRPILKLHARIRAGRQI